MTYREASRGDEWERLRAVHNLFNSYGHAWLPITMQVNNHFGFESPCLGHGVFELVSSRRSGSLATFFISALHSPEGICPHVCTAGWGHMSNVCIYF
jgi:hypothetical protein